MMSLELEVLPVLIGKGLFSVTGSGPFVDIGTPESYAATATVLGAEFRSLAMAGRQAPGHRLPETMHAKGGWRDCNR
jgi:NDP-sugar pyrophosphorylase family protein